MTEPAEHDCSFAVLPPHDLASPGPCQSCGKSWERSRAERSLADAVAAMG